MSLEAIKKVAQTEADAKQRKAEALVAAKKMVSDAQLAGEQTLRSACAEADTKTKELMRQAEERAAGRAAEIAAQSKEECAILRSAAENKLEDAAALIVRRVVSS